MTFGRLALLVGFGLALSGIASAQAIEPDPLDDPDLVLPDIAFEPVKPELGDPKTIEPALGRALDDPDGFCKDHDYELSLEERRLCDMAEAARPRCPGFVSACERPTFFGNAASGEGSGTSGKRERSRGNAPRGSARDSDRKRIEISTGPLGALLGGIIEVLFWGLLVVGIGAMLYAGVKALLGRRHDPKLDDETRGDATVAPVARSLPTGSPEELLARARELALSGQFKAAMSVVLRALLRRLEIDGRLELHPSRTNGDYVRSLRRQGFDPREFRGVAAEVEAVEFGGVRASPEAFSALHARVSKLVQMTGAILVCLSLGALTACDRRSSAEDSLNSCGAGASGYSVLCETLEARGVKLRRRFAKIESIADDVGRVVMLDDDVEPGERQVLLDWVRKKGGTLVVLGRASSFIGTRLPERFRCGNGLVLEPGAWNAPADVASRFSLPQAQVFASTVAGSIRVRCGEMPFVVESREGAGTIVGVADFRFATNAGLAIADNAVLAASLVAPPRATVELIGYWTGSGSELPAQSLTRAGLLPWFLHVLALGLVFALYKGSPFGSRREPVTVTRRAFAEHALALGDAYSRARASRQALVNFGSFALERLRVRLQATKHGRLTDLAGAVAARHSVSEAEVMSLVVAVRSAEDQAHDSATEAEHLAALRRLAALVKKTGGTS